MNKIIRSLLNSAGYKITKISTSKKPGTKNIDLSFSKKFKKVPGFLLKKVGGTKKQEEFLHIGKLVTDEMEKSIPEFNDKKSILDFGCGLGRVLATLKERKPEANYIGFDIDPLMLTWIEFLQKDRTTTFCSTTLDLNDGQFDLIYAISVFTHLDLTTDYWLSEMERMLAPGGKIFVTYNDETLYQHYEGVKLDKYHVKGKDSHEGGAAMATFYTTKHWEEKVKKYFEVDKTVPRGLFGHQSYSILSKKNDLETTHNKDDRAYIEALEKELYNLKKEMSLLY